ncbi:MAG: S41 family peptidase [Candidatus Cloacimonadia bacterium]
MVKRGFLLIIAVALLANIYSVDWDEINTLTEEEKLYGLSLIWKEADYNFAFFKSLGKFDWNREYLNHISQVLETDNIYEYYRVLQKFVARLQDNQSRIGYPSSITPYLDRPRVHLKEIEGRIIVHNIGHNNASLIPVRSEVLEIEGVDVLEYLEEKVTPYISASNEDVRMDRSLNAALLGIKDEKIRLKIKTPELEVKEVEIVCNSKGDYWSVDATYADDLLLHRWLDDDILYVVLYRFHDPLIIRMFDSILPDLQKCKGLIIDIQENNIGKGEVSSEILKYLVAEKEMEGFATRTRINIAEYRALGIANAALGYIPPDEYAPYGIGDAWYEEEMYIMENKPAAAKILVPTYVMTGSSTGTAAENFLLMLKQHRDNVTVIGSSTGGQRGQPLIMGLPGGGSVSLTTTADFLSDEKPVSNRGIEPDVKIKLKYSDYINDEDTVLKEAYRLLRQQLSR